ncbi:MAG: protease inhibitor I42 family protein [Candidatus Eremiobacterota bacterium]
MNVLKAAANPAASAGRDAYPVTFKTENSSRVLSGQNGAWIVQLRKGTDFTVELPENSGSTGLRWNLAQEDLYNGDGDVKLVEDSTVPGDASRPGNGGTRRFRFDSADDADGMVRLRFELTRPWNEGTSPAATRQITLMFV